MLRGLRPAMSLSSRNPQPSAVPSINSVFGSPFTGGNSNFQQSRNTTILCVKKNGKVAMAGDGLVTQGNYKVKPNALKVRTIGKGI